MSKTTKILIGVVAGLAIIALCLAGFVTYGLMKLGGDDSQGGGGTVATPLPTTAPPQSPGDSFVQITEPRSGSVLNIDRPVDVSGVAGSLPEGSVVVEAVTQDGTVLGRQATTIDAADAGTGGQGPWSTQLDIRTDRGTPGQIRAYSSSPADNSLVAEAKVAVIFGQPAGDIPPLAVIEGPSTAQVGQPVVLKGGNSQSANRIVSYDWDLGDGTTVNAVEIEHVYNAPGIYIVTLTVTDQKELRNATNFQINIIAEEPGPTPEPEDRPLEGVEWVLNGTAGPEITALFEEGTVTGFSGCNGYSAPYLLDGSNITIAPPTGSQIACDEADMAQETIYLANLAGTNSYAVKGDTLTLSGIATLVYTAR